MSDGFHVSHEENDAETAKRTIRAGLEQFNKGLVGPSNRQDLVLSVRDIEGRLAGGLTGVTAWGYLFVEALWLDDTCRGHGLAQQLMTSADDEARRRGCHSAWLDTFNPKALTLYHKLGFSDFGILDDCPMGHTRHFLRKLL